MDPVEIRTGTARKQPIHFGAPRRPLFGFYHPANERAWRNVGVVLCNPIGTDQTRSERTYRHLAQRLAEAGFACLRFDLFGTGDSGGEGLDAGVVQEWVDDIGLAVDELRARSGAQSVALVGLRLGASFALLQAATRKVESLVLWSPCVSGAGFVAEVTKLHKLYTRIEAQMAGAPAAPGDGEEALGCFFSREFMGDLARVDLLRTESCPAKRTLIIDGGNVTGRDALLSRLRELDASPELRTMPGHKFLVTVSHRSVVPDEVLDSITAWLDAGHPKVSQERTIEPLKSGAGPSRERPFVFGEGRSLFGILTPADGTLARANRPAILLTNAGCVNRAGPHGMYSRLARRWAKLGFDVLRVDLSGIGDSPAMPETLENLTYPPSALGDLGSAIRALGASRVIVLGLCSGGDYAFQLGAKDPHVVGAWLLNPRTFSVLALAAVESGVPPASPVDDVPRTLGRMAERGVDTLLVVSRNDPGVAYVDAYAGDAMRALEGTVRFRRIDLDGADHSFTPVAIQARVSDLLTEHLVSRY